MTRAAIVGVDFVEAERDILKEAYKACEVNRVDRQFWIVDRHGRIRCYRIAALPGLLLRTRHFAKGRAG
jgi:hypothetical protein